MSRIPRYCYSLGHKTTMVTDKSVGTRREDPVTEPITLYIVRETDDMIKKDEHMTTAKMK